MLTNFVLVYAQNVMYTDAGQQNENKSKTNKKLNKNTVKCLPLTPAPPAKQKNRQFSFKYATKVPLKKV